MQTDYRCLVHINIRTQLLIDVSTHDIDLTWGFEISNNEESRGINEELGCEQSE